MTTLHYLHQSPDQGACIVEDVAELPPLSLTCGVTLNRPRLAWRIEGPEEAPLLLVLGGISAHRGASRWWPGIVGPGAAIDTRAAYRVLSIDWLAGADGSATGASHDVPISVEDQASALLSLLQQLALPRLKAIVGASFGGLVAQSLLQQAPALAQQAIILGAAHQPDPYASGLRHIQRRIIKLAGDRAEGVALARALAVLSYRSPQEFAERFEHPADVAGYLDHCGQKITQRFDQTSYTALSRSIDQHRGRPEQITTPLTLVAFDTDLLAPPAQIDALARAVCGPVQQHTIRSIYGHDAFLKETTAVGQVLTAALREQIHVV